MESLLSTKQGLRKDLSSHLHKLFIRECRVFILVLQADRLRGMQHNDGYDQFGFELMRIANAINFIEHKTVEDKHFDADGTARISIESRPLRITSNGTGGQLELSSLVSGREIDFTEIISEKNLISALITGTLSAIFTPPVMVKGLLDIGVQCASLFLKVKDPVGLFNSEYYLGAAVQTTKETRAKLHGYVSAFANGLSNFVGAGDVMRPGTVPSEQNYDPLLYQISSKLIPSLMHNRTLWVGEMMQSLDVFRYMNTLDQRSSTIRIDLWNDPMIDYPVVLEARLLEWTLLTYTAWLAIYVLMRATLLTTSDGKNVIRISSPSTTSRMKRLWRVLVQQISDLIDLCSPFRLNTLTVIYGAAALISLSQQEKMRSDSTKTYEYSEIAWVLGIASRQLMATMTQCTIRQIIPRRGTPLAVVNRADKLEIGETEYYEYEGLTWTLINDKSREKPTGEMNKEWWAASWAGLVLSTVRSIPWRKTTNLLELYQSRTKPPIDQPLLLDSDAFMRSIDADPDVANIEVGMHFVDFLQHKIQQTELELRMGNLEIQDFGEFQLTELESRMSQLQVRDPSVVLALLLLLSC